MSRHKTPRNPKPLPIIGSACHHRSRLAGYRKHSHVLKIVAKAAHLYSTNDTYDWIVAQFYID